MRAVRWLALMSLALAVPTPACSGDYPLPPTRCDEYCDATKGGFCQDYYSPAGCVAECESRDLDVEGCAPELDVAVSCFRESPVALRQRCTFDDVPDDCDIELGLLLNCVGNHKGSSIR